MSAPTTSRKETQLDRVRARLSAKAAELEAHKEAVRLVVGALAGGEETVRVVNRVAAALLAREPL